MSIFLKGIGIAKWSLLLLLEGLIELDVDRLSENDEASIIVIIRFKYLQRLELVFSSYDPQGLFITGYLVL